MKYSILWKRITAVYSFHTLFSSLWKCIAIYHDEKLKIVYACAPGLVYFPQMFHAQPNQSHLSDYECCI